MKNKIALITPYTVSHRTAEETLALGYLAAVLRRADYETIIVDAWLRDMNCDDIVKRIFNKTAPSIVCLSCYRSNLTQAKEILDRIKNKSKKITVICGGYGPTFHDEEFLKNGFDIVVRGEAETMIVKLIEAILSKDNLSGIPGISFIDDDKIIRTEKMRVIDDLDVIPLPERDEIKESIRRKNPVHLCTSRGCNGNCSFCSIAAFNRGSANKVWRGRSIDSIITEIQAIYEEFGVTNFKIVDDSFIEPPRAEKWTHDFAEELRRRNLNIRFRTQVRADRLTREIVQNLKNAGWFATSIGIENFSANALMRMNKRATVGDNFRALEFLREYNIYTQIGLILFDNLTSLDELAENCETLSKYNWVITKGMFTEMFAAEGTIFTQKLKNAHLLKRDADNQNYRYDIEDSSVRRVYAMLKAWHKSHARIYDWTIDSITAPKVLSDEGYESVHALCMKLLSLDIDFFKRSITWIQYNSSCDDDHVVKIEIDKNQQKYEDIENRISIIYSHEGLTYNSCINPFID